MPKSVKVTIQEICDAAVDAGLAAERGTLLKGIDEGFVATLQKATSPAAQVLSDLHELDQVGQLADGSFPLEIWLKNANTLARARREASIFRRALGELLDKNRPTPAYPDAKAPLNSDADEKLRKHTVTQPEGQLMRRTLWDAKDLVERVKRLYKPNPIASVIMLGVAVILGGGGYFLDRLNHSRANNQSTPSATPSASVVAPLVCPEGMLPIPEATFQMGSPPGVGDDGHPPRTAKLRSYCMDRTEVTVTQYRKCANEPHEGLRCAPVSATVQWSGYSAEDVKRWSKLCNGGRKDHEDHPINCVDWSQADTYCRWAGRRLPTEAEWEYGAGGGKRKYPWGDDEPGPKRLNACGGECAPAHAEFSAMYEGNDSWPETAPVGSYPAGDSPFGLSDMAGNVWEWTSDRDGLEKDRRIVRGGSWADHDTSKVSVTGSSRHIMTGRDISIGFRCASGPTQ